MTSTRACCGCKRIVIERAVELAKLPFLFQHAPLHDRESDVRIHRAHLIPDRFRRKWRCDEQNQKQASHYLLRTRKSLRTRNTPSESGRIGSLNSIKSD